MKILFTGGGSGGHFYPIIAIAEAIHEAVHERKLLEPELLYAAPDPYDREMLNANAIMFVPTAAGKMRRYFSFLNFLDYFKTGWGVVRSVVRIFFLYPDVVFGKGGYASFPSLFAARLLGIPVVIHESDALPGRVNAWASGFAQKIAVAFQDAEKYFPKDKVVFTGNPIRKAMLRPLTEGAYEFLKLERETPTILILGGSQGAATLNETALAALPQLIEKYQVVHQTGESNIDEVTARAGVILGDSPLRGRYQPFGYLNDLSMRMGAGVASLIISRAGSTIFEIAAWGLPSILVPIPEPTSHDQMKNAFAYARTGAATVIEQNNLTAHILASEASRILESPQLAHTMSDAAKHFAHTDAAKTIANLLLDIAISHEK